MLAGGSWVPPVLKGLNAAGFSFQPQNGAGLKPTPTPISELVSLFCTNDQHGWQSTMRTHNDLSGKGTNTPAGETFEGHEGLLPYFYDQNVVHCSRTKKKVQPHIPHALKLLVFFSCFWRFFSCF